MLDRFTACWDLRHPFWYVTCFYCQLGTLFNSELIKLNSLRVFFLSWSKTNCQNTPEISPGKSRRCRQVFSKAQFLSFYFLWWDFQISDYESDAAGGRWGLSSEPNRATAPPGTQGANRRPTGGNG